MCDYARRATERLCGPVPDATCSDVTFWEERFRRHDIPLRFERRSGWSSTLLPVEAAKTVEWDLDMYHVEGYDEERPDDAVSYIGEKMLLCVGWERDSFCVTPLSCSTLRSPDELSHSISRN